MGQTVEDDEKKSKTLQIMKNVEALLNENEFSEVDKTQIMKTTFDILTKKKGWSPQFNDPENYVMDAIRDDSVGFEAVAWLQIQGLVVTTVEQGTGMFIDVVLAPTNH